MWSDAKFEGLLLRGAELARGMMRPQNIELYTHSNVFEILGLLYGAWVAVLHT